MEMTFERYARIKVPGESRCTAFIDFALFVEALRE